ncbi:BRCA2, helical [Musa troglodytarum]|uniref:BRCA2, helical n=1 Tax=Musa troglodytarum TaxID=320322 RepID=A0A9E7KVT2_9LILI|nr:BRCA2, helical [Musa troglodytarum]
MHHSGYGVLKNDQKVRLMLGLPKRQSTVHQFRRLATSVQDVSVSLAKLEEAYKPEKQTKAAIWQAVSFILFQIYGLVTPAVLLLKKLRDTGKAGTSKMFLYCSIS